MYFLYVETKGPTLEEIAKIFDRDEAEVGLVDIDEKIGGEKSEASVEHRAVV